jgi:hypothetical protein
MDWKCRLCRTINAEYNHYCTHCLANRKIAEKVEKPVKDSLEGEKGEK